MFVAADIADEAACTALVETVAERLGGLTVLVNNAVAGSGGRSPIGSFDTARWEQVLRVNLTSVGVALPRGDPAHARAGHGSIVNVSSRQAERASAGLAAYGASKGGLERADPVDRRRVRPAQGVRCNALSVGYVENERRDARLTPERRAELEAMHLTRLGQPEDVALGGRLSREPRERVRHRRAAAGRRRRDDRARRTLGWAGARWSKAWAGSTEGSRSSPAADSASDAASRDASRARAPR